MKYDRQKAFPYPVLMAHCDDFVDGEFQTITDFKIEDETIKVNVIYHLSSEDILDLIEKEYAAFVTIISCRETYFRSVLKTHENINYKEFRSGNLRGEVKIDSYVSILKPISDFYSEDINAEFGPGPFIYQPGHVVAQSEAQAFYFEREMFSPLTSVFDLVKRSDLSDDKWSIFFDEEHVQIEVSTRMKEILDNARNTKHNKVILMNSLYFSAVMQAIYTIKNSTEYENRKWFQVIKKKAHNIGCDIENQEAYLSAQALMKHPLGLFEAYRIFEGAYQ